MSPLGDDSLTCGGGETHASTCVFALADNRSESRLLTHSGGFCADSAARSSSSSNAWGHEVDHDLFVLLRGGLNLEDLFDLPLGCLCHLTDEPLDQPGRDREGEEASARLRNGEPSWVTSSPYGIWRFTGSAEAVPASTTTLSLCYYESDWL